jgi:hypothetical protein
VWQAAKRDAESVGISSLWRAEAKVPSLVRKELRGVLRLTHQSSALVAYRILPQSLP